MYPLWLGMPGRFQQKRSRDLLPQVLRHAIVECPDCGKKNHVQELAIRVRMKCGRCQRILGIEGGDGTSEPIRTPRLTVRCAHPDTDMPPTEVTFGLPGPDPLNRGAKVILSPSPLISHSLRPWDFTTPV
jgi:ribosomal protein S27AE